MANASFLAAAETDELWSPSETDSFIDEVCSRRHRHVCFFVGSAASLGLPSGCLGVAEVRRLALEGILRRTEGSTVAAKETRELLLKLQGKGDGSEAWAQRVCQLPFEQFLGCVSMTSEASGEAIVRRICGSNDPNGNHASLVRSAVALLGGDYADIVSIITTNYDLCLDRQLASIFGKEAIRNYGDNWFPSYEVAVSPSKVIRYAKIHGCVSAGRLVFSFAQMLHLLVSSSWEQRLSDWLTSNRRSCPSLALFAGYGFWDSDLRSWMCDFFCASHIFRIERQLSENCHDEGEGRGGRDAEPSATAQLQTEFFANLHKSGALLHLLRSALVVQNDEHTDKQNCLTSLLRRLTQETVAIPLCPIGARSESFLDTAFLGWDESSVVHFVARLVYSCNLRDRRTRLLDRLRREHSGSRQVDLAHCFLHSFGVVNNWVGGIAGARALRRKRMSLDVNVTSWGYESFSRTLAEKPCLALRAVRGGGCLVRGWLLRPFVSKQARAVFEEYSAHYRVKALQGLLQASSGLPAAGVVKSTS